MSNQPQEPLTLRIERTIRAPRERVYNAWVDPEEMKKWSAPETLTIPEGSQDLRVGGKFHAVMVEPNGTKHVVMGQYREVTPPSRLVYTHAWLKDNGASNETTPETIVTVEFFDENDATRVVLTQIGFTNAGARDGHVGGWTSAFNNFVKLLEQGS
ncbi:MAG: SRPBCC domain-containing protein [Gemmatimonas sp.]